MFNEMDIEILHTIMEYDNITGKVYWKERYQKDFPEIPTRILNMWNTKHANTEIKSKTNGYYVLRISLPNRKNFRVKLHRAIFAYVNGYWPDSIIDHIDGNRLNNRMENLRISNKKENAKNSKPKSNSGYKNISWEPRICKWVVKFRVERGKQVSSGTSFADIKDAVKCRDLLYSIHKHPPARDAPNDDYILEKQLFR